jgi:hypothetical protein
MRLTRIIFCMIAVLVLCMPVFSSAKEVVRLDGSAGLDQAMAKLVRQLESPSLKPLAMAVADPQGPHKRLSKFSLAVVNGLNQALLGAGFENVLERRQLNKILEDQQLELSGLIDQDTMAPMNKKLGIAALVFVNIQDDENNRLAISARLVDAATGRYLATGKVWLIKGAWVRAALREIEKADLTVLAKPLPPGASLYMDGGQHWLTADGLYFHDLPQGRRELVIKAPCLKQDHRVTFDLNRDRILNITLEPTEASLELLINPPTARISVDGTVGDLKLDHSGAGTLHLPGGRHTITVMAPGHPPVIRSLDLQWCRNHPLSIDLTRREYRLALQVSPKDARASLDGAPLRLDASGAVDLKVERGRHTIKAVTADHLPYEQVVDIQEDTDLPVVLKPEPVRVEFMGNYQDPSNTGEIKELKDGCSIQGGWHYNIALRASKMAYVYVFQLDSSGNVSRLFPRPQFPELKNPVEPDRWIWSPPREWRSKLDSVNTGPEAIYVVASPVRKPELEGLLPRLKDLKNHPGLKAQAKQAPIRQKATRDESGLVQGPKMRTVFSGELFDAARRLLDESGGQVQVIRFEHR